MNQKLQKEEELKLLNLNDGDAAERFDFELAKVLKNILDPNTDAKATRKVVLTVTIKPDEKRERLDINIQALPTLAPYLPSQTMAFIGKDAHGNIKANEYKPPQQMNLFNHDEKVTSINKGEKK